MSKTTNANDSSNVTEINRSAFGDIESWNLPDSLQNPGQLSLRQRDNDGKRYVIVDTRQSTATAVTRTSGFENDVQLDFETVEQAVEAARRLVSDDDDDEDEDESDNAASDSDDSDGDSDPLDDSDDSEPVSDDSDDSSDDASNDDDQPDDSADDDSDTNDAPTGEAALSDDVLTHIETSDAPWRDPDILRAVLDAFDQKSHAAVLLGCAPPTIRKWELRLN